MKAILKIPLKRVWPKAAFFRPLAKKMEKIFFFDLFLPKVFYKHVAFSLDNPLENNQRPKTIKKIIDFSKKNFSPENTFVDTYFAVLTTALEKFQQKKPQVLAPCPNMVKSLFQKVSSFLSILPNGQVGCRFHSPAEKTSTETFP